MTLASQGSGCRASDTATTVQDVREQEGQDDAHYVESQVRSVHKVAAETGDYDVDDEDDTVDDEQIVLLMIGCVNQKQKR